MRYSDFPIPENFKSGNDASKNKRNNALKLNAQTNTSTAAAVAAVEATKGLTKANANNANDADEASAVGANKGITGDANNLY